MEIVVMSCDKFQNCWKPFFTLYEKYFKNDYKVHIVTETLDCEYANTIKVTGIWTERLRKALEQIKSDNVILMLDDFFIRSKVNVERIEYCKSQMNDDIAVFNFEKKYRDCDNSNLKGFERQFNNQVYLQSAQPSLWNKQALISRLQEYKNPWEWETEIVNDNYIYYINTEDFIIDVGYRHQPINIGWGITRGRLTEECKIFLKSEGLDIEWSN